VSKRRDPPSRGLQLFPVRPFTSADGSKSDEQVSEQAAGPVASQPSAPLLLAVVVPIPSDPTVQGPPLQFPVLPVLGTPAPKPPDPQLLYSNLSLFARFIINSGSEVPAGRRARCPHLAPA
jgi:hypothetical protein